MKKYTKIIGIILGIAVLAGIAYATATTASLRKSAKLPWQGVTAGYYDPAHNVGASALPQARFSFAVGITKGATSVVQDSVTGLMWESVPSTTIRTWDTGKTYCANLTLGAYTDWRMPNIRELISILDYGRNDGANYWYDTYFTLISGDYWTSTTNDSNTNYARRVEFSTASASGNNKTTSYYVICTR